MKLLIILLLALVLLISACEQQSQIIECTRDSDCELGMCNDGTTYKMYACSDENKCVLINYYTDPCEKIEPENTYYIGDNVIVGGKTLVVKDITQDGELILSGEGRDITILGTDDPVKISNQEIVISKLNIVLDPSKRYVLLNVGGIILNKNEYALSYMEQINIQGKMIQLTDVYTDKLNSISVKIKDGLSSETKRINKGKTEEVLGLRITNVRAYPRAISYEKYAIIKIE